MKAVIYRRVSTEDQEKEGTSLKTQLAACQEYCQKNGYEVSKSYSPIPGLTLDRPKLVELRDLLRVGDCGWGRRKGCYPYEDNTL
jgi:site-specific DNA recombinase